MPHVGSGGENSSRPPVGENLISLFMRLRVATSAKTIGGSSGEKRLRFAKTALFNRSGLVTAL
jgi:hypothetical protein